MSNYDNSNRGSVWKNEDRKSDSHPQFKGSAEVDGVEYWVSGWLRKPAANPKAPAMNFSFSVKENQPHSQPPQQRPTNQNANGSQKSPYANTPHGNSQAPQQQGGFDTDFDDDIPF
jgi:hypothetical protein